MSEDGIRLLAGLRYTGQASHESKCHKSFDREVKVLFGGGCKSHSAVPKVSCGPTRHPNAKMGSVAQAGISESEFCPIKRGGIISRSFELILL